MKMTVNMAAFFAMILLLFSTAHGYTYAQYSSIASQANSAYNDANAELGAFRIYINNAAQYGLPRSTYDAKASDLQNLLNQANSKMYAASYDADEADGYALAYSEQSTALSLSNQAKQGVLTAEASLNSAIGAAIQFSITPSQYSAPLENGKSTYVSFQITSQDTRTLICYYSESGGSYQDIWDQIYQYGSNSFEVHVSAPYSGSGTNTIPINVECTVGNYATTVKTASITLQYGPAPAKTAMQAAEDAIDTANDQIDTLDEAIKDAVIQNPSLDAFLGDARAELASAQSAVSQAQDSLSSARGYYYDAQESTALSQANSAISSAQSVSKYVNDGQAEIARAKEAFKSEAGQAQLAISSASGSIGSAQSWIDRANGIIENATALGMDTKDQLAQVDTAKGLLENSQAYLESANYDISSSNYAQAKIDAASAQDNANQSEAKAKQAYESFASIMQACQVASEGMDAAQAEITNADEIYTRLASVVKNLPSEVNANNTAQDIETQRQKLDLAKNEYSNAQNQISAGYCNQSVDWAIKARNDAANASNMLERVAERMKDTISAALDASAKDAANTVENAKNATTSAGGTYGADSGKVAAAQQQLAEAQANLTLAQNTVLMAKGETNLGDFLDQSAQAFDQLSSVKTTAQSSLNTANSAKTNILTGLWAWFAGILAACGVGFMFWKSKLGKKGRRSGEVQRTGTTGKMIKQGKFKEAAELYAKAGKFDKASEMYKRLHKKRKAHGKND